MSLQVCYCGWSKVTSYKGLRIHQGKMGCTPRGMGIPESEQFRFNSYVPKFTYMVPPIQLEEPVMDRSFQVCHNGWDESTSNQGWRMNQQSCRLKEESIPEREELIWRNSQENDSRPVKSTPVKKENVPVSPNLFTQMSPESTEASVIKIIKSLIENQQLSAQMRDSFDRSHRALEFSTDAQPLIKPVPQPLTAQMYPPAAEVTVKETNKPFFETPQRSHQTAAKSDKARRALDFSSGAEQAQQMLDLFHCHAGEQSMLHPVNHFVEQEVSVPPTTTAQETAVHPTETEREKEKEKEREAQKLLKAKQDRRRAEFQQKIQIREQKLAEVRLSAKSCKGSLDAEWLEINNVFTEVMKVVEDARQKALQPLEERRQKVKREAKDLVQKLETEIAKLKSTIDELDKNPDMQDELRDWKNASVDTSFSFGTLRTTTSAMMEQIHLKLEKLSSVELKRIPTFAVDVQLDPTTAHQCLVLSEDGKEVRDGGKNQKVPDTPDRFDTYGSVLGLNSLTSGRSYWEVEVSNKTGWDLGVARGDANRKGKLSLNPDNGYWVTVHYEDEKYAALTAPPVSLSLTEKPRNVGVFVDYEEGLVSFYDVTAQSHIYSFTECWFRDEIFPYFSPHLKQNEKNSDPLIISAVKKQ
ncbi:E3 ubiquitin-protein ligase TRIM21-like [Toxotes jaculatrix]|uniref:E3 ubiquitin-protein ligase TRIM21-like n=1 Tax=Toxotes jaculatrix TaxID=941984 RepID=UPI001B3AF42E|nr:E3 ubiquitin-protein ligase TRIM21-like [Toxotes jaculatrix]